MLRDIIRSSSGSKNSHHLPLLVTDNIAESSQDDQDYLLELLDPKLFLMTTIFFCLVWLIGICLSAVTSSVEAFGVLLKKPLQPLERRLQSMILQSDSSDSDAGSSVRQLWNDLSPPFAQEVPEDMPQLSNATPDVTHFCFLIHGHRGLSKDLTYLQTVMERLAAIEKRRRWQVEDDSPRDETQSDDVQNETLTNDTQAQTQTQTQTDDTHTDEPQKEPHREEEELLHDMVVHNAVCNEYKTTDGICKGGDRLVEEMRQVIEAEMKKRHSGDDDENNGIYNVTISLLGNSLGGLIGRYAIAKLVERHCVKENDSADACWILDGKYRLHLNIFCTTATPHLGVSRHTYVRLPRTVEIGAAHAMGDTGRDLFRLNDLLHTMATCPTFLGPLAGFRKRIAYANAYGTDFAVPVGTAAFLSETSSYPHHFEDEVLAEEADGGSNGLIIATVHTPTQADNHDSETDAKEPKTEALSNEPKEEEEAEADQQDELHHMSMSLDRLGWKKVFIDIRRDLPSMEIPKSLRMRRQNSDSRLLVDTNNGHLHALKTKKVVSSKDVATAVSQLPNDNRVALPLGHNMMIAFSRTRFSTFLNKGGRPVVDALAKELVEGIFQWDESWNPHEESSSNSQ